MRSALIAAALLLWWLGVRAFVTAGERTLMGGGNA